MAFTVEDGSGVAGANSYLAVVDADTYHSDRGNSDWTGTDAVKQAALIEATDFIESRYTWVTGVQNDSAQGLSWPRADAENRHGYFYDNDEVPEEVQHATAYLALEALGGSLVAARGRVQKRVKAGAVEIEYADSAAPETRYPYVDGLLKGLARYTGDSGAVDVELT